MTWNYRIMRHTEADGISHFFEIHEVYYKKDGTVKAWTKNGVAPSSDTPHEMKDVLSRMMDALSKDVLDEDTGTIVES